MPADLRPVGGQTAWRRRSLLAAAATLPAAGLGACSVRVGQPATASTPVGPTRDELARGRAAAEADVLAATAVHAASVAPSAARTLRTIAGEHQAHAAALRAGGAAAQATPSVSPSPTSPGSSASPSSPAAALRALASREQQAVAAVEADLAAVDGALARLLASVAACRSVHVALLGQLADDGRTASRTTPRRHGDRRPPHRRRHPARRRRACRTAKRRL